MKRIHLQPIESLVKGVFNSYDVKYYEKDVTMVPFWVFREESFELYATVHRLILDRYIKRLDGNDEMFIIKP